MRKGATNALKFVKEQKLSHGKAQMLLGIQVDASTRLACPGSTCQGTIVFAQREKETRTY